jgi:NAD(P)H-dependent FMN reductase
MIKIAIITGSTRPNRKSITVAKWAYELAAKRTDAQFELVDIVDYNLPLLDEPELPATGKYTKDHTKKWSAKINEFDAYIFVTPEYNHSTSAALKNAIDFLYNEWTNKAAGFIGYGAAGASRAVEHLRGVMATLQVADVRAQVALNLHGDFENGAVKSSEHHEKTMNQLIDQLISWGNALKTVRSK